MPAATGRDALGLLRPAISLKTGLPSPAGNDLDLDDAANHQAGLNTPLSFVPDTGR